MSVFYVVCMKIFIVVVTISLNVNMYTSNTEIIFKFGFGLIQSYANTYTFSLFNPYIRELYV
jgi:hypothetical protein